MNISCRKIAENFVRLVLPDGFRVALIPCVNIVKFKFLALFPVDHLAHIVLSTFILFLHQFAAFAYYVNDRFISIIILPTFAIFLHLIYSYFYIIIFNSLRVDSHKKNNSLNL